MLSSVLMLPHGAEIIPTPGRPYAEAFRPLHEAMQRAGHDMAERNTDLVFLVTPHGYSLQAAFAIYLHDHYLGLFSDLSQSNITGNITLHIPWAGDHALAEALLAAMLKDGIPADGLSYGGADYPLPLGWGESVPLYYIGGETRPRVVIVCLPRIRHTDLAGMQPQLAGLGRLLLGMAAAYPGSASIVSSADLAHTHSAQGPYGFHESAAAFDATVQQWAASPQRGTLDRLLALQPTAKACGMAGMCMLQTIFEATQLSCRQAVYAAPTYFGMMVAQWVAAERDK